MMTCHLCGVPIAYEFTHWFFNLPYCDDCAAEILTEHDVLEDEDD